VGQYYCPKYHAKILPRKQGFATAKNALCRHLVARRRIAANNSVKAKSNKSNKNDKHLVPRAGRGQSLAPQCPPGNDFSRLRLNLPMTCR
jgi:hypothetical protein